MKTLLLIIWLCAFVVLTPFNTGEAQQSGYGSKQKYGDAAIQPSDIDALIPEMNEAVELWLFVDNYRFVTGKMIHLTLQLVWKLGVSVNMEEFKTVDLSPFRIEKVTVGERQIFNNDSDFCVITYILSLPDDADEGVYTVPSFSIPYTDEVNRTSGQVQSSTMALKKVPVLVETELDRDVINIGDRLTYTITIWHEKYIHILEEHMRQLNFSPFHMRNFRIRKDVEGKLKKTTLEYELSIYELPDKSENFEIPSIPVLYCNDYEGNVREKEDGKSATTMRIGTPEVPVIINSLLKRVDVPLEGAKGPLVYSQKDIFLRSRLPVAIGVVIIIALGATEIKKLVYRMSVLIKERMALSPLAHAERLEQLISGFDSDADDDELRKALIHIDCTLRGFLGALKEVSGSVVLAVTTRKLTHMLRDKKLAQEIIEAADKVLKSFDSVIFGDIKREVIKKAMDDVQKILKEAKRHGYY